MTNDNKDGIPKVRPGPIKWLGRSLRAAIEKIVSEYTGCRWRIKSERDLAEFACHPCAIVTDDSFAVFFKYSREIKAKKQFEVELSDLRILSKKAGVLIPQAIDIVQMENGCLFVMEALETIQRGPKQWRQIGEVLARIHQIKGNNHGFKTNGFWGPLFQDNSPARCWADFFRERRLLPCLKIASDSGNLPSSVASNIETLVSRLPELCGPEVTPSLLHGDAQQNNFICTADGTYVIDPAVYYGHREIDLALIDAFQPVPDEVFDGYRGLLPINPGFDERRDLWRIPLYLAAFALEGSMHLDKLTGALQKYI
jgi:fructosamine-3-kinase